jgi:methionyl-tRNA formyltransferase
MAGDTETGVMVMQMEEGLDTGPVLMAERVPVGRKTSGELTSESITAGRGPDGAGSGALGARRAVTPQLQSEEGVDSRQKDFRAI